MLSDCLKYLHFEYIVVRTITVCSQYFQSYIATRSDDILFLWFLLLWYNCEKNDRAGLLLISCEPDRGVQTFSKPLNSFVPSMLECLTNSDSVVQCLWDCFRLGCDGTSETRAAKFGGKLEPLHEPSRWHKWTHGLMMYFKMRCEIAKKILP